MNFHNIIHLQLNYALLKGKYRNKIQVIKFMSSEMISSTLEKRILLLWDCNNRMVKEHFRFTLYNTISFRPFSKNKNNRQKEGKGNISQKNIS